MIVNKKNLLNQIIEIEDPKVLAKIALLISQENKLNVLNARRREDIPQKLNLVKLKKEQGYDSKNLAVFMENWDYNKWEDLDLEKAIKEIG